MYTPDIHQSTFLLYIGEGDRTYKKSMHGAPHLKAKKLLDWYNTTVFLALHCTIILYFEVPAT